MNQFNPGNVALSVKTAYTVFCYDRNASLWHPCMHGRFQYQDKGYIVDSECAPEAHICNEALLGRELEVCPVREYQNLGLPPRCHRWLASSAMFSPPLPPKPHDELPLHRPKSDNANWAWLTLLKPWVHLISRLLQVILTQWRKDH